MTQKTQQKLFDYLHNLGAIALETDMQEIERILTKEPYELLESMQEPNRAILIKAGEFERKYNKCIATIMKFDAGIVSMYDL